jgi:alanine dehydrogenase
MAGTNAAWIAAGMEAEVTIVDKNVERLRFVDQIQRGRIQTVASSGLAIERLVLEADLVVGAVLVPGAKAPHLVSEDLVARMQPGAVLVDISIDQGGCFETSHVTTHSDPTYVVHGVVHYCVGNMPGAVPRTSTYALTNVTLPHVLEIATSGLEGAVRRDPALALGVNVYVDASRTRASRRRTGSRRRPARVGRRARMTDGPASPTRCAPTPSGSSTTSPSSAGLSTNTVQAYRRDLRRYLAFLGRGASARSRA